MSNGSKSMSGLQKKLSADSPIRSANAKCHSGICSSEPSKLGAGS